MSCRQYSEMYTTRILYNIFLWQRFFDSLCKKITKVFQALNGLRRNTVGKLRSWWAFVTMLLGFTRFGVMISRRSTFSDLENFDRGTLNSAVSGSKRS